MLISLPEACTADRVAALWRNTLPAVARLGGGDTLTLDAEAVAACDGAGEALIVELYRRSARQ
ncbi:MAG: STAS domain-containing protein, partial [Kiritimatiellia bacterium]|nr:STAS domain-containing protein [Kiritimatiellia bacterium]